MIKRRLSFGESYTCPLNKFADMFDHSFYTNVCVFAKNKPQSVYHHGSAVQL